MSKKSVCEGSPPGHPVKWTVVLKPTPDRVGETKTVTAMTAFYAAAKLGLAMSQCESFSWQE